VEKNATHANNNFEIYRLHNESEIDNSILISLYMISMFTNIPLNLAISSIKKRHLITLKTNEFVETLKFIFSSIFFTFNNKIYEHPIIKIYSAPL